MRRSFGLAALAAVLSCLSIACAPAAPAPAAPPAATADVAAPTASATAPRVALVAGAMPSEADAPIPIGKDDPVWGSRMAPVTMVVFGDFQCPFTARFVDTVRSVRERYGPESLRVVWKNQPLAFHPNARPAAVAAQAVFSLGGSEAFWKFHDAAFRDQRSLGDAAYEAFAEIAGVSLARFRVAVASAEHGRKVDEDAELGKRVGATGTPTTFVNGVLLMGSQPAEKLTTLIDDEARKARTATEAGLSPDRVYVAMTKINFVQKAQAHDPEPSEREDTKTVFAVPVGKSPVRGKADAPVTIVMFEDFQCPFCKRAQATLEEIRRTYGDKVRFVWKNEPLPFHPRAVPAANLAYAARAQRGDAGFWAAHDALFASQPKLDDADLDAVALKLRLDVTKVRAAIRSNAFKAVFDEDQRTIDAVSATGTPHFFINGRRLVGAQPFEKFKRIIDEELARGAAAVPAGDVRAMPAF